MKTSPCDACGSQYEGMCGLCYCNCLDTGEHDLDPRHAEHCLVCARYEPWLQRQVDAYASQFTYTAAWLAHIGRCVVHQPSAQEKNA
jgi:hypothetical protein